MAVILHFLLKREQIARRMTMRRRLLRERCFKAVGVVFFEGNNGVTGLSSCLASNKHGGDA
jgi:hypothetical protein